MSPAFLMRRRADEFDRLVDPAGGESAHAAEASGDLVALADLARGIRELPAVEPRAAFSLELRERLMTAAATDLATGAKKDAKPARTETSVADKLTVHSLSDPTRAARRQRRLTAGIAVVAIIGGTAGTAFASRGSLPGDTLYPVKRAVENVQTGFSIGDDAKGSTMLGDANTRLSEVRALTRRTQRVVDSGQIRSTLESFSDQATRASDLLLSDYRAHHDRASITKLRTFVSHGMNQLGTLGAAVPDPAKDALTEAAQTLVLIDQAAAALCPDCGGPSITELPSSLLAGLSTPLHDLAPGLVPGDKTPEASQPEKTQKDRGTTGESNQSKPNIPLPSVDPNNLLPGSVTGQGSGGSTGGTSKDGRGSGSSGGSGSGSGSSGSGGSDGTSTAKDLTPSDDPTSLGDALDGTVDGVVDGVGGLVGGLLGGLSGTGD